MIFFQFGNESNKSSTYIESSDLLDDRCTVVRLTSIGDQYEEEDPLRVMDTQSLEGDEEYLQYTPDIDPFESVLESAEQPGSERRTLNITA